MSAEEPGGVDLPVLLETEWQVHAPGGRRQDFPRARIASDCPWFDQGGSHFVIARPEIEDGSLLPLLPCLHPHDVLRPVSEAVGGRGDICFMLRSLKDGLEECPPLALHGVDQDDDYRRMTEFRAAVESAYPGYEVGDEGRMVAYIRHRQALLQGRWYLVKEGSAVVGAFGLVEVDTKVGRMGRLQDLDIHPDLRGRGLGNALLSAACERAQEEGLSWLVLRADWDDWPRPWYGRHGFYTVGICRRDSLIPPLVEPSSLMGDDLRDRPQSVEVTERIVAALSDRLALTASSDHGGLARLASRAGGYLRRLERFDEGEELLERSLLWARQAGDAALLMVVLIRLAHLRHWQERWVEGEDLFREAALLVKAEPVRCGSYEDFRLQHLGKMRFDQGRWKEALRLFEGALAIRQEKGDGELVVSSEQALAVVRRALRKGKK